VTIGTLLLADFDAKFKIEKTLKPIPNTCVLSVYNLNEDHRAQLEELRPKGGTIVTGKDGKKTTLAITGIPCKIEAGYGSNLSQLWLGDLRTINSVRVGTDWVTNAESGDAEKAYQNARIHVSYGPQTPVSTALRAMAKALGVGSGNVERFVNQASIGGSAIYPHGTVISGSVAMELTEFCKSADLDWSIQDGSLQIIPLGKALAGRAIKVSEDTGMVGSPTVDADGILTVKILMVPDVRPGRLIVMDAERIKGNYKIQKATWSGSTFEVDWYITVEVSRY
jgi:hypothetical protein